MEFGNCGSVLLRCIVVYFGVVRVAARVEDTFFPALLERAKKRSASIDFDGDGAIDVLGGTVVAEECEFLDNSVSLLARGKPNRCPD